MAITREDVDRHQVDFSDVTSGRRLPPVHPGEILRDEFLVPLDLSVSQLAEEIQVADSQLNDIVLGRLAVTTDTAQRLGRYFGTTPEFWINLQTHYDQAAGGPAGRNRKHGGRTMVESKENQEHVEVIANESLEAFSKIAEAAKSHLATASRTSAAEAFADINILNSPEAVKNMEQISQDAVAGYSRLSREPAIARVQVRKENGERAVYYICRAAPMSVGDTGIALASYRSPVGRLAALSIGEEHTWRVDGEETTVEVLEQATFHPILEGQEWDSKNSVLKSDGYGPLTVESLRVFRKRDDAETGTTLLKLLEEDNKATSVREGLRRSVITNMALRDRPILDKYQDDIFRLPLNSRLLILGAPGTGKTTTLIKRLGQKLDLDSLDEDERRVLQTDTLDDHAQSWIMFTPTELLKLYVKEAFNKEGIPAPEDRISTWEYYRDNLARNEFGILRSAADSSSFVMRDSAHTLEVETETDQISWFSDFDQWQKSTFWGEMRASARSLSENAAREVAKLGSRVLLILDTAGLQPPPSVFVSLTSAAREIQGLVNSMKEATDQKIDSVLNLQVNRDRQFLDDMAEFIEGLTDLRDEPESQESEDEEEPEPPRVGRAAAAAQYRRAVRSHARARARRRRVSKTSRTGRLIEWIDDRSLGEQDLLEVGDSLVVQSALSWFVNPVRRYINGIPTRYRRFRRVRQGEKQWYRPDGFGPTDLHPLEVDILLLAMIRGTDELVTSTRSLHATENPARATLERLQRLYRTQVLVDEATDFSPIQLACMAALAHPGTRSFFACGDFNQRVTNWGTRSVEEIQWAVPDLAISNISVGYRQSRQLHDLGCKIVGSSGTVVLLPDYVDHDGVAPVLAENMTKSLTVAKWLAERIGEIERFVEDLPSVAVFVNDEEAVRSIATDLGDALADRNIRVIPCSDGWVLGREGTVRVFNIQHIKGLEFEAAFFVGVDRLAELHPDLFDKYLYVGATRAATYLGMTCERGLPVSMMRLQKLFGQRW